MGQHGEGTTDERDSVVTPGSLSVQKVSLGVFVVLSLLWGCAVDGTPPDRLDVIGGSIVLLGVAAIMYWPR